MSYAYDGNLLYQFLVNTPEGALRKMLISPQFSDVHFNFLMKIVRCGDENQFCEHFYKEDFPKIKLGPKEIPLKENFWSAAEKALNQHGLLSPAQKAAA